MITLFTILVVVAGFVAMQYLYLKHISRLELLTKARDLNEVKNYEETKEPEEPENEINLRDVTYNKPPEEVQQMFNA